MLPSQWAKSPKKQSEGVRNYRNLNKIDKVYLKLTKFSQKLVNCELQSSIWKMWYIVKNANLGHDFRIL